MNKIKVRLNICGTECTLTSEDNETYVLALGDEVEKSIQSIMARNDRVSLTLAAIITALSFCDESKKATAAADNLRSQIKDYLEDSSRSRLEADEARREIERMKQEIQTLRTRLSAGEAAQAAAREAAFTAPVVPEVEVPVQKAPVQEEKTAEQPEMPEPPYEEEPVEELRPAAPAVPNVHTGHYSRPLSAEVPEELDRSSFMSFFEKKETD
ncbi:MAG: cell division protein ZapA [Clostridium sp.]|uniref:cell division protein ZapA n=1 Tax=Clostridium sp. TaxID=1506 RepID=UPI00291012EE|nr:cell division protein ZapA [Clostridium sp.]MDU7338081.1 cell division protein ZapA [Clostridium sp.]